MSEVFTALRGGSNHRTGAQFLQMVCMVIGEMHLYNIYMHGELNDHQVPSIKDCRSSLEEFHMQLCWPGAKKRPRGVPNT